MRRAPLLAALAAILLAAGRAAAGEIVIGLLLPPEEPDAVSIRRGALAAVEEANAAGGSVRLAVRGRKGAWGSDAGEAARLVEDDGAAALVAPPDGAGTHLVLQIAGRTGVPVATLCPDRSVTGTAVPWVVRVAPSTAEEARALLDAAPPGRWLAVVPRGRAGREAARDLASAAGTRSLVVVEEGKDASGDAALALRAGEARVDGVLLWTGAATAARLARALRGAGYQGVLAGPSRLGTKAFRAAAGPAAGGISIAAIAPEAGASPDAFAARFRARFGDGPEPAATLAHDAAALLIRLVAAAGPEGARSAFPLGKAHPGASGPLAFDARGNRIVSLAARRLDGPAVKSQEVLR